MGNSLPELLTVPELQEYLKCKKDLAYKVVHQKDFPSFKVGGKYYVNKDKLPDWIDRQCRKIAK